MQFSEAKASGVESSWCCFENVAIQRNIIPGFIFNGVEGCVKITNTTVCTASWRIPNAREIDCPPVPSRIILYIGEEQVSTQGFVAVAVFELLPLNQGSRDDMRQYDLNILDLVGPLPYSSFFSMPQQMSVSRSGLLALIGINNNRSFAWNCTNTRSLADFVNYRDGQFEGRDPPKRVVCDRSGHQEMTYIGMESYSSAVYFRKGELLVIKYFD